MTGVVRLDLNGAGRTAQLSAAQAAYDYAQGAAPQSPAPAQTAAPAPQAAPAAQRLAPSDFVNQIAHSINSEPTVQIGVVPNPAAPGRSDAAYDEAAARLLGRSGPDGQQPAEPAAPAGQEREPLTGRMKKMTGRIRLTGKAEDEQEGGTRPFTEELPRVGGPHYDSAEDAPRVRAELEQRVLTQDLCTAVTAILSAVLCYFSVGAVGAGLPLPGPLDPAASPAPLLVTMLVLLALGCAVSWKTMLSGLVGLLREPTADSMPTLAALGAAVQLAVFLSAPDLYTPSEMVLMAGPAMLLLCFNSVGKGLDARTVRDGWTTLSLSLPATPEGYVVSGFLTVLDTGACLNADARLTVTREDESILDMRLSADDIPLLISSAGPFAFSWDVTGDAAPDGIHLRFEGENADGAFTIRQKDAATGDAMLTLRGTATPGQNVSPLNWTARDLDGLAFFSVSDTTLSQFAADVLPTFARGVLPLLAHAPVKACQALMDLVTGTGILDLLTSSSTRLDGAEEESGFDEEGWFDEEESFDGESWFDEEGSGIDWDDDSLYE